MGIASEGSDKSVAPLAHRTSKYNNKKTIVDGIIYVSKGEANRAQELQLLLAYKQIQNLEMQVRIPCIINDKKVFTYVADFVYIDSKTGEKIIEDFKGMETSVFKLKRKILEAQGVKITIVKS